MTITTGTIQQEHDRPTARREAVNGVRATAGSAEFHVRFRSATLFLSVVLASLFVAGVWAGAIALGAGDFQTFISGYIGIGGVSAVAFAGIGVLCPWKSRAIADWMTMWLAATVFRLLITPIVVYLLYSASPDSLAVKPLALAAALTYLATLFFEAVILARSLHQSCVVPSGQA